MRLIVASRNAHKVRELEDLLAGHELVALPQGVELPPETGITFAANAAAKARFAAQATGGRAIADDSGIASVALSGEPGVRSARFAGESAGDDENLAKLLHEVPRDGDRRVAYLCALAFAEPGQPNGIELFEGRCEGELALVPRGEGGFGYDPAFVPAAIEDGRTMAELSAGEKAAISHRGRAARALLQWLDSGRPAA